MNSLLTSDETIKLWQDMVLRSWKRAKQFNYAVTLAKALVALRDGGVGEYNSKGTVRIHK